MSMRIAGIAVLAFALAGGAALQPARAAGAETKCHMTFNTSGWAVIYKHINGSGTVRCDDGTSTKVRIHIRGAGLTAGKYSIENGKGDSPSCRTSARSSAPTSPQAPTRAWSRAARPWR